MIFHAGHGGKDSPSSSAARAICVYSVNRFDPFQILWIIRIKKAGILLGVF